jgi:hypothetical protein
MSARRVSLILAVLAVACGGDGTSPEIADGTTFGRLERSVLVPTCATAGCHVGTSATAAGNLVLSAGQAYDNLVGVAASNANARQAGLRRVVPGHPDSSLLYHKVVFSPDHHGEDYGNPMPVGGTSLSVGQIEYIRRWIAGGARRTGDDVSPDLLLDRTIPTTPPFSAMAPPPAGRGVQLKIDPFTVKGNFERELFVYRRLGNTADMYVSRIQTQMRPGSHHFVLYTMRDDTPALALPAANTVRDLRNADGSLNLLAMIPMAFHVFVAGAMTPVSDYTFPPGVALRLPPNTGIDLNAHYVNRTSAEMPGEAYANLWTVPANEVQKPARSLNCTNTNITLPPKTRTTLEHECRFSAATTIILLTSHMHELGERFQIRIAGGPRNGEVIYDNTSWEHPAIVALRTPVVLQAGEGLRAVVTWNNTTDRTVRFGLTSTDEMSIIFGYAY